MKTADLYDASLDWAVAAAIEKQCGEIGRVVKVCRLEATTPAWIERENWPGSAPHFHRFSPSTEWAQGGPIIERERIGIWPSDALEGMWAARPDYEVFPERRPPSYGPTPLIAAMRCYVSSKLGDEIEVPEALC